MGSIPTRRAKKISIPVEIFLIYHFQRGGAPRCISGRPGWKPRRRKATRAYRIPTRRRTAKEFRKWIGGVRFPKRMRRQAEIKWSASGIKDDLRTRTIKHISRLDVRVRYVYLLRNNIPSEYRDGRKILDGLLYTNVVGELLDMYLPIAGRELRVFCDKRRLSGMTKAEFRDAITARMRPKLPVGTIIQVETVDSTVSENIQIADWIAGALARWHEKGPLCEECRAILRHNIIGEGKELFNLSAAGD